MKGPRLVVIGSCNTDMSVKVKRIPAPGETVGEGIFHNSQGGKGANQAVSAARAGGDVTLIACVGEDSFGLAAVNTLAQEGVHVDHIHQSAMAPTGVALITVDNEGENCISLAPGANQFLSPAHIDEAESCIGKASFLLIQLEIPYDTAVYAIQTAKRLGVPVLFNPAPAREIPASLLQDIDVLVVNKSEASIVAGLSPTDHLPVEKIADHLEEKGVKKMVISLGKDGVYARKNNIGQQIPAFKVEAIDSTGAGDVLCGSLSLRLALDDTFWEALTFSMAAASLSVTRQGAQSSAPERLAIHNFLELNRR